MTRGILSHSPNIKDCNRIVNLCIFPLFRIGGWGDFPPFLSRFPRRGNSSQSLTNDRAFLLTYETSNSERDTYFDIE